MKYIATIQWSDNGNIQDDMILKIGDIEDDDDDIFFYFESLEEMNSFKEKGIHEWTILNISNH